MSDSQRQSFQLPPEQQAIRDKCFHPSGTFVEFPIEDVETSISADIPPSEQFRLRWRGFDSPWQLNLRHRP